MIDAQLSGNDVVISSRIRLARNIAEFPFIGTCSDRQRQEIEAKVREELQHDERLKAISLIDSEGLESLERQFLLDLEALGGWVRRNPDSADVSSQPKIELMLDGLTDSAADQALVEEFLADGSLDGLDDLIGAIESESESEPRGKPRGNAEVRAAAVDSSEGSPAAGEVQPSASDQAQDGRLTDTPEPTLGAANVTINEEDHLRITITRSDVDLDAAWDEINKLDDLIGDRFNYAFSDRFGYLTACPANVGTGMRVSVVVHLPALAITGQVEKVFRSLHRGNVIARGVFGEQALGDFYRICNQATLGVDETELIDQVTSVIPTLVRFERAARKFLLEENREGLVRQVTDALEAICQCDLDDKSDANNEFILRAMSQVRLGIGLGLLDQDAILRVNRVFLLVNLRHQLLAAITREDYQQAAKLRDRIERLERSDNTKETRRDA